MKEAGELKIDCLSSQTLFSDSLLEELRLESNSYINTIEACLLRLLLRDRVDRKVDEDDEASFLEATIAFREARGLFTTSDLERWLKELSVTKTEYLRLIKEEQELNKARSRLHTEAERLIPSYLKFSGKYGSLAARALKKCQLLSQLSLENPTARDAGMDDQKLLEWHFREILNLPMPNNLILYAKRLGFRDVEDFVEALRRERCYLMHCGGNTNSETTLPLDNGHASRRARQVIKPRYNNVTTKAARN
jgi:hypothetical protein